MTIRAASPTHFPLRYERWGKESRVYEPSQVIRHSFILSPIHLSICTCSGWWGNDSGMLWQAGVESGLRTHSLHQSLTENATHAAAKVLEPDSSTWSPTTHLYLLYIPVTENADWLVQGMQLQAWNKGSYSKTDGTQRCSCGTASVRKMTK